MKVRKSVRLAKYRRENPCGFIYKTTNNINNKIYIGQFHYTTEEKPNYLGSGKELQRDIKKYGKENFTRIILEQNIISFKELEKSEIKWTNFYNPQLDPEIGYNRKMGNGTQLSQRLLKKMSEIQKKIPKKPHSQKTKNKLSMINSGMGNGFYGKYHTKETKEKLSKLKKGKKRPPFSKSTCEKLRKQKIGGLNPNSKSTYCYYENGILFKIFPSVSCITQELGITKYQVKFSNDFGRIYKGYYFKFMDSKS